MAKSAVAPKVAVTGASGLIGLSAVRALSAKQIHVIKLIRKAAGAPAAEGEELLWDPEPGKTGDHLPGLHELDAAVHLSGANVSAHRWTAKYKREILRSRVDTTQALCRLLVNMERPPSVLVCASAIGIYGDRGDEIVDEDSPPGSGFLAETCKAWEAETREAEEAGIRVVHLRFGIVLAPVGGALGKLAPLFKTGLGGRLGSGRQWMSWVTLDDVVAIILRSIGGAASGVSGSSNVELRGAANVTSPGPVTNAEFTRLMGKVLGRPAVMAVPAFALRLAVGDMADEALLAGCRAVPTKLSQAGFVFDDPLLEPALRKLLR
jgi:uncharacterized protein (TIGR01777 family)